MSGESVDLLYAPSFKIKSIYFPLASLNPQMPLIA